MSNNSMDKFSRVTSLIALFIAVLAVLIPYIQQSNQFEIQQQESLNIDLNPQINAPIYSYGEMGKVIQMPWRATISNTSNRPLSLIDYRVTTGESPRGQYYSGIDGGIVNQSFDSVILPLRLDVGESRSFYIYVGAIIPTKNYDLLAKVSDGKSISDRDSMLVLAKAGVDLFGNKVKYHDLDGENFHIEFSEAHLSELINKTPTI